MAIKNIEMSVYNGSSYDTLLPVTSSENVTIASAISGLFGLGADSTLTDILQKLSNAVIWDGSSTELPNGSSIVTGARIETGSYVGTGTYGASNPCSLTFDRPPILLIMLYYVENSTQYIRPFYFFSSDYRQILPCFNLTTEITEPGSESRIFQSRSAFGRNPVGECSNDSPDSSWRFCDSSNNIFDVEYGWSGTDCFVY